MSASDEVLLAREPGPADALGGASHPADGGGLLPAERRLPRRRDRARQQPQPGGQRGDRGLRLHLPLALRRVVAGGLHDGLQRHRLVQDAGQRLDEPLGPRRVLPPPVGPVQAERRAGGGQRLGRRPPPLLPVGQPRDGQQVRVRQLDGVQRRGIGRVDVLGDGVEGFGDRVGGLAQRGVQRPEPPRGPRGEQQRGGERPADQLQQADVQDDVGLPRPDRGEQDGEPGGRPDPRHRDAERDQRRDDRDREPRVAGQRPPDGRADGHDDDGEAQFPGARAVRALGGSQGDQVRAQRDHRPLPGVPGERPGEQRHRDRDRRRDPVPGRRPPIRLHVRFARTLPHRKPPRSPTASPIYPGDQRYER
ncbi:hypothetical protein BJF79_11410 [Actinomadura sp. CNU-125]|nr:hypothetical protein BJF79_11410 [Actinomadura sp. CNU-125]